MEYIQEITLDLNSSIAPPIVYTKQGDADTRVLKIHLMEDGNEYRPPAGANAVFRMRKPDGTVIADYVIASVGSNIVTVRLSEQALAAAGRSLADILLYGENQQYLSTASFILVIQPAPVEVMRGQPSESEYKYFEDCLAALATIVPDAQEAADAAAAASDSAQYWANNFSLTAGTPVQPGEDPSITGTAPAYTLRLPSVKPMAAITINESGEAASATVTVEDFPEGASVPTGLNRDLIKVFNFGITLPSGRNIQIDETLSKSGQAADAAAVGSAISEKYTKPTDGIPLSDLASDYIIPIEHGGIGVSIDTAASSSEIATAQASARANIGAQQVIQVYDNGSLAPSSAWEYDAQGSIYSQTISVPLNNVVLGGRVPEFIASPKDMVSWRAAADVEMGPPTAETPTGTESWLLTFQAESASDTNINITVYWW